MNRLTFSVLAATLALSSSAAYAQATINGHPADFDQYPSFLEASTHLPNNAETVLRCGYSQSGTSILPDASYMEFSLLNPSMAAGYMRYQRIDNKIILTVPAPGGMQGRYLLQITEPNGMTAAKNCQMDLNTDTISNCSAAQAFAPAAEATKQDQGAAQQCGSLFSQATPKMDTTIYNAQKTDLFKAALRQKVALLEAP
jgi:hypothetical protein